MNLAVSSVVRVARTTPAEAGAIEKLGVFLGHWRTTGEMKETP